MKLPKIDFQKSLIFILVCGCLFEPACAALGLLFVLAAQIAERYFTRNVSDKDRQAIQALKTDVEKLTVTQQKEGLAKAFGGRA